MTHETTDRELLELASKAAGLRVVDRSAPTSLRVESDGCKSGIHWNPLTDDGDALRLAVKLDMDIHCDGRLQAALYGSSDGPVIFEERGDDPFASTRRAIVRAAAEIGRNMQ